MLVFIFYRDDWIIKLFELKIIFEAYEKMYVDEDKQDMNKYNQTVENSNFGFINLRYL